MPSLKDIRKRIASVRNTQKITRAMKLVSAAKLRRAQQAIESLRPFAEKYRQLLGALGQPQAEGEALHPLLDARAEVKAVALLVLTSDRGMCGGFNSNLLKLASQRVEALRAEGKRVVIYPLGRRAERFAAKQGYAIGATFGDIMAATDTETIRAVTDALSEGFLKGELDEVHVVLNEFKNAITQIPTSRLLLPISAEGEGEGELTDVIFEPDAATLLGYVVPRYVEVQVRRSILESIAGEHAARMNAMNSATDNAADMISSLTLQMNRARQAAITKELMEIIGGAEALK
ncbi:ATP synthase F1 subunit gamma [Myxococcota bacterium]|nr:ATP synthase F1 subunit gamma [Myxococcota bacterium]MBU1431512.1 ATP synthase F1 subunit gamma [Myxococcota bacterium]MBU1898165.1 ATP synthase F1 subunit gamma [Myxococcota bacterium]